MATSPIGLASGTSGFPVSSAQWLGRAYTVDVTPTIVDIFTTSEQTFTCAGLETFDAVFVTKPTHQTGLGIVNARVSARNTLAITFMNATAGQITPTSETYRIVAFKCGAV